MEHTGLPDPQEFIDSARKHFGFLEHNGFLFESTVSGTGETVTFTGVHAAVRVSSDRRDDCIDFSVMELSKENNTLRWQSFSGLLVKSFGYRGSLVKFRERNSGEPGVAGNLQVYASALQHFLPRLVAGADLPLSQDA